jgi:hypothetical protein
VSAADSRPRIPVVSVRVGAAVLAFASLLTYAALGSYFLSVVTPDPPNVEYGPSFGFVLLAIALGSVWWVPAAVGFVVLWISRIRSIWTIPFLAIALGFAAIAIQVATNEPIRDPIAYAGLGLLVMGSVSGAGILVWRRPFGLVADILLALVLLYLAYDAVENFSMVGSPDSTTLEYGPSAFVGYGLILPAIALLIWPRTRSTATE